MEIERIPVPDVLMVTDGGKLAPRTDAVPRLAESSVMDTGIVMDAVGAGDAFRVREADSPSFTASRPATVISVAAVVTATVAELFGAAATW